MGRPRAGTHTTSTPERILDAAAESFALHGFEARLSDIAAKARIRRPSLLYHFASKEELYTAVVVRAFVALGDALRTGRAVDGDFEDRLQGLTTAFVRFVEAHPSVAKLILRELIAEGGPGTAILMGQVAPLLDEVERWIATEGGERLRVGVPVRAAALQVVSDVLLRSASGSVRDALWGPADVERTWMISRTLLLRDGGAAC